jgi:hypothetical protein
MAIVICFLKKKCSDNFSKPNLERTTGYYHPVHKYATLAAMYTRHVKLLQQRVLEKAWRIVVYSPCLYFTQ